MKPYKIPFKLFIFLLFLIPKHAFPIDISLEITTGLSFSSLYGFNIEDLRTFGDHFLEQPTPNHYSLKRRINSINSIYLNINLFKYFSLKSGLILSLRGATQNANYNFTVTNPTFVATYDYDGEYKVKMNYLDLSLWLLEVKTPYFKKFCAFLTVGPLFSCLLSAKKDVDYTLNKLEGLIDPVAENFKQQMDDAEKEYDIKEYMDPISLYALLNYGLKIKMKKGNVILEFKHFFASSTLPEKDTKYEDMIIESRLFSFSVGYEFPLGKKFRKKN